jgi:short-subunit dehydrogenase
MSQDICLAKTPMTAGNDFHMPFVLEADDAARRIVRALERRRKVFNFPWQTSLLMRLTHWFPDWLMARAMRSYNEAPPMPATPLSETPPDEPAPRDRLHAS